jgi:peptide-methionine (S)-S-oxide reductase
MTKALIGGGCFWGIEEYYRKIKGVLETKAGYSGGMVINPTYEEVCKGDTEHAEVVLVYFDHKVIAYSEIIDHFWLCHDPTQLNRQGLDMGRQYRSVIFFYSDQQKILAENSKEDKQKKFLRKIVTEIKVAEKFYLAEDYHQQYIKKRK